MANLSITLHSYNFLKTLSHTFPQRYSGQVPKLLKVLKCEVLQLLKNLRKILSILI